MSGVPPHRARARPDGPLAPLLTALLDPDPDRRPSTTAAALERLRRIGVPAGMPWRNRPGAPSVPNRWGPDPDAGKALARALSLGALVGFVAAAALAVGVLTVLALRV